jgi:hypothetical protein
MATLHAGVTGRKPDHQSNKSKQATARGPPPEGYGSYTIGEWCRKRHISRATFYRMKKRGETPVTIRVSGRDRITREDDEAWYQARRAEALQAAE